MSRRVVALALAMTTGTACGGSTGPDQQPDPASGTERRTGALCGNEQAGLAAECASDEFCVESRGALCMPLPPPGGECSEGCVLTEHCCNCSAFACLPAPADACGTEPTCGCVERMEGFSENCPADRRECVETQGRVDIVCIEVDFDEDPFADAGSDGA